MLLFHALLLSLLLSHVFLLLHAKMLFFLFAWFPLPLLYSYFLSFPSLSLSTLLCDPLLETPLHAHLHVFFYCVVHRHLVFSFKIVFQNACPKGPQHSLVARPKPLRPIVSHSYMLLPMSSMSTFIMVFPHFTLYPI